MACPPTANTCCRPSARGAAPTAVADVGSSGATPADRRRRAVVRVRPVTNYAGQLRRQLLRRPALRRPPLGDVSATRPGGQAADRLGRRSGGRTSPTSTGPGTLRGFFDYHGSPTADDRQHHRRHQQHDHRRRGPPATGRPTATSAPERRDRRHDRAAELELEHGRPPTPNCNAGIGSTPRPARLPLRAAAKGFVERAPRRGQLPVRRRLGEVPQEEHQPASPTAPWAAATAARSPAPIASESSPRRILADMMNDRSTPPRAFPRTSSGARGGSLPRGEPWPP